MHNATKAAVLLIGAVVAALLGLAILWALSLFVGWPSTL
jgi:hypothetical protein